MIPRTLVQTNILFKPLKGYKSYYDYLENNACFDSYFVFLLTLESLLADLPEIRCVGISF